MLFPWYIKKEMIEKDMCSFMMIKLGLYAFAILQEKRRERATWDSTVNNHKFRISCIRFIQTLVGSKALCWWIKLNMQPQQPTGLSDRFQLA